MSIVVRKYWRIGVIAILGALIAFGGSFVSSEKYSSSTRLLIRGREATFLTSTGDDLSKQPGVIDASLSKSLAETQAGIVTSREVATMVVDKLNLDVPKKSSGFMATIVHGVGTAYKCTKAFVSHGFCRDPEPREGAIQAVQAGVSAGQLGASSGESSGQPNSFILDLTGAGETPEQARDVANTAADAVVTVSAERFAAESKANADRLGAQAKAAATAVSDANQAAADFRITHNLTDAENRAVADVANATSTETQASEIANQLAGARAELDTLNNSIAAAQPTQASSQDVVTGRSSSRITTNSPNPVYNDLITARENLRGHIADLEARAAEVAARPSTPADAQLTQDQTALLDLQVAAKLATDNQSTIDTRYRSALVDASRSSAELTRIDTASLPTYPDEPRRIIYLALGLLFGAIAGGYLTWRRQLAEHDDEELDDDDAMRVAEVNLTTNGSTTNGSAPNHNGVPSYVGVD